MTSIDDINKLAGECRQTHLGITSPILYVCRDHQQLYAFTFDKAVVEEIVQTVTTEYKTYNCEAPLYTMCFEFEHQEQFNAAVLALIVHFGAINSEKDFPF